MERRRRAFGFNNLGSKKNEEQTPVASSSNNTGSPASSLKLSKTGVKNGKQCPVVGQGTPKHKQPAVSPITSPSFQPVFPRTLSSPEIEVSWDWDCSQATSDKLPPPKRPKRKCQLQVSPLVEPVATTYSRLTQSQETSTKENEERLAFYKNILSKSFQKKSERVAVVENNNVQLNRPDLCTTPQRPRRGSPGLNKSLELVNDPFDDSANEFMLECSQAIEEKLKTGEIQVAPLVKIDLGNRGKTGDPQHPPRRISQERTKQNLFSNHNGIDVQKDCQSKSLKSPLRRRNQVNSNLGSVHCQSEKSDGSNLVANNVLQSLPRKKILDEKVSHVDKKFKVDSTSYVNTPAGSFSTSSVVNIKTTGTDRLCDKSNSNPTKTEIRTHPTMSREYNKPSTVPKPNYDSVDKFRRPNQHQPNVPLQVTNPSSRQVSDRLSSAFKSSDTKNGNPSSITSLLDDDFDMELSSLDFDSLVRPDPQVCNKKPPESRKCSKQEIEAKRLAALNKLMMKKKR